MIVNPNQLLSNVITDITKQNCTVNTLYHMSILVYEFLKLTSSFFQKELLMHVELRNEHQTVF